MKKLVDYNSIVGVADDTEFRAREFIVPIEPVTEPVTIGPKRR